MELGAFSISSAVILTALVASGLCPVLDCFLVLN
jgi:hypothetical protein